MPVVQDLAANAPVLQHQIALVQGLLHLIVLEVPQVSTRVNLAVQTAQAAAVVVAVVAVVVAVEAGQLLLDLIAPEVPQVSTPVNLLEQIALAAAEVDHQDLDHVHVQEVALVDLQVGQLDPRVGPEAPVTVKVNTRTRNKG